MRKNNYLKICINGSEAWKRTGRVLLAILFMSFSLFGLTGCGNKDVDEDIAIEQELDKDSVNVGNDGVNGAIAPDDMGPDDVTLVSQQNGNQSDQSMVTLSVENAGRADPFLPYGSITINRAASGPSRDLIPPPESITVDTTATEVMTTKVSGIMYDKYNPSAILNISGEDYLVRSGDTINNYKVLSIAKEHVTVQYGANVYKAGVGEIFTDDGINYNTVSNLERKFGGNKKK